MKKKIMAVTLCLAMVSTFAVGCGQKNETDSGKSEEKSSGKVEIEFVQVKREAAESYTKVIEAFEKENPDIVIKQNVVPDAQEVLMTRASSDSLPDMMNHWPSGIIGIVLAQLLQGVTYMTMYYSCAVYISTCVYEKYQTKGQSILNVVQLGLGAIVGNLVGGKLIRLLGYEKGYLLMAGITTLMTICALIVYFWKNREQRNGGDVCEI